MVKKGATVAKKRYFKGKGYSNPKLATMARDIARLKSVVNVEKKFIQSNIVPYATAPIGQVNINAAGLYLADITPLPIQGVGQSMRTGNEIKLVSMCFKGQIKQQVDCRHPGRLKIIFFKPVGPNVSTSAITNGQFLTNNPLTTVIDYGSTRNVDFFKNYTVMKTLYVNIPADNTSNETMLKDVSFITKLSHHLKWDADSNSTISNGQIYMLVLADSGNRNVATASTLDVPIKVVSTGYNMQYYTKFYYVDN